MKTQGSDDIGCGASCIVAIVIMWVLAVFGALQIIGSLGGMIQ